MIDELERVKRLRPSVQPPTSEVRRDALEQLYTAIGNETGAQHADRAPGFQSPESVPGRMGSRGGQASRLRSSAAAASRRRARLSTLGLVVSTLAVVVIAGGALFFGHARHRAGSSRARSGARGLIVDRNGTVLATTRRSVDVQIDPAALPASAGSRDVLYRRLALTLDVSTKPALCHLSRGGVGYLSSIACAVARSQTAGARAPVTVARDVPEAAARELTRNEVEFPGVTTASVVQRLYPLGDLASQLLGTTGPITQSEAQQPAYRDLPSDAVVGQSGIEAYYDRYLGDGHDVELSLDARLQSDGQLALQHAITANPPAAGGAFVAMNPQNGDVYAMGSLPTYNANMFSTPPSGSVLRHLNALKSGLPLLNRAIASAGSAGSTLAPITAIAALESHHWNVGSVYDDTGAFCFDAGYTCLHNLGHAVDGPLNLVNAIRVSSNDFFYNLGARTNSAAPQGGPLQNWARQFGIGQKTGIDLPGEVSGTLPSPAERAYRDQLESECEHATGPFKHHGVHASCGISDGRPWSTGDNINLAVGQGDVQITPMQLAVAYAAIANGGNIVRPHLALNIKNASGSVLQNIDPPRTRHITIDPLYLHAIKAGLRAAAARPGGTADDVFANFPEQVFGKTGTAQYITNGIQQNYAWYAGFVPATATSKPITVVVTIEQGGYGAHTAAPVAHQILSQWFFGKPGRWQPGASRTQ